MSIRLFNRVRDETSQMFYMLYNVHLEKINNFDSHCSHWWIQMGALDTVCSILNYLRIITIIRHQTWPMPICTAHSMKYVNGVIQFCFILNIYVAIWCPSSKMSYKSVRVGYLSHPETLHTFASSQWENGVTLYRRFSLAGCKPRVSHGYIRSMWETLHTNRNMNHQHIFPFISMWLFVDISKIP